MYSWMIFMDLWSSFLNICRCFCSVFIVILTSSTLPALIETCPRASREETLCEYSEILLENNVEGKPFGIQMSILPRHLCQFGLEAAHPDELDWLPWEKNPQIGSNFSRLSESPNGSHELILIVTSWVILHASVLLVKRRIFQSIPDW